MNVIENIIFGLVSSSETGPNYLTKEMYIIKLTKKFGMTLLGVWLIMTGLLQVFSIQIPYIGIVLSVLAIVAGALLLLGK